MYQRICLSLLFAATLLNNTASAEYDFRIVIDVSGSMRQTDPQNLRVPALKLVNGLIPSGSRAGVWIFGRYVDMAVKWGRVDAAWRQQADLGADKIHSNALLTNIESALARATVGWQSADDKSRRILLLLTDGKVDVSKDSAKNEASRRKVLGQRLSALKAAGAEVHAIALSDSADEVLLKRLALETGGSFAVARDANALQKLFFKMFERASKPDVVEFDGNEFRVDSSIKEMTLLLFRQPGSDAPVVIPPNSPALSAAKPRGSRWRNDMGYDLVTVAKPEAGVWRIDAEMDPDNRLMVVTDLRLEVNGVPAYASPDQTLEISAELFNREQQIRRNSFLRFVDFAITHIAPDGTEQNLPMAHTKRREDKGRYLAPLAQKLVEGTHRFVVSADSRTFNRSNRYDLQVQWPLEVLIEPQAEAGRYELKLRAREEYLKPDGIAVDIQLEAPDGTRQPLVVEPLAGWQRATIDTDQAGIYQAHIKVSAQNHATEIWDIDLGSFPMLGVYREPPPPVAVEIEAAESELQTEPDPVPEAKETTNWRMVGIIVVAVNVSLLLLMLVAWLLLRRKQSATELLLDEEEIGV